MLIEAARAAATKITPGLPGPLDPSQDGGVLAFVQNAYLLALAVAGLLALGSIAYGAVQYTLSRGNPAALADAWDRIVQALVGALLLVGAGAILAVVNPGLTTLQLPYLAPLEGKRGEGWDTNYQIVVEQDQEQPTTGGTTRGNGVVPPATDTCISNPQGCSNLAAAGFKCQVSTECTAHKVIVNGVKCAADRLGVPTSGIIFTEAYPVSGLKHCSVMHYTGCSADFVLPASYARNCEAVKNFYDALTACGVFALNEYYKNEFAGCGFKASGRSTGNHFHVEGCPSGTWGGLTQEQITRIQSQPACKKK